MRLTTASLCGVADMEPQAPTTRDLRHHQDEASRHDNAINCRCANINPPNNTSPLSPPLFRPLGVSTRAPQQHRHPRRLAVFLSNSLCGHGYTTAELASTSW